MSGFERTTDDVVSALEGQFVTRSRHAPRRKHLRGHDRRRQTLKDATKDKDGRRPCDAAQYGGEHKAGHSEREHPLAAEQVSQPATGDQENRIGRRIGGNNELHFTRCRAEVAADCGKRQIDNVEIEDRKEGPREQNR
jgi:hypothetical protein